MSLPTYDAALATARPGSPFSNGTESECWFDNWCHRCVHDRAIRTGKGSGCPLILVSYEEKTPVEWMRQEGFRLGDQYHCIYFRDEDDPGPDEPTPIPDPPGQLTLVDRDEFERPARMFTDTRPVQVDA